LGIASIIKGTLPLSGSPFGNCVVRYYILRLLFCPQRGEVAMSVHLSIGKNGKGEKTKLLVQGDSIRGG